VTKTLASLSSEKYPMSVTETTWATWWWTFLSGFCMSTLTLAHSLFRHIFFKLFWGMMDLGVAQNSLAPWVLSEKSVWYIHTHTHTHTVSFVLTTTLIFQKYVWLLSLIHEEDSMFLY
jgi:hypothetical protein